MGVDSLSYQATSFQQWVWAVVRKCGSHTCVLRRLSNQTFWRNKRRRCGVVLRCAKGEGGDGSYSAAQRSTLKDTPLRTWRAALPCAL